MTPTNQNPFADGSYGNDRFNATNGHFPMQAALIS